MYCRLHLPNSPIFIVALLAVALTRSNVLYGEEPLARVAEIAANGACDDDGQAQSKLDGAPKGPRSNATTEETHPRQFSAAVVDIDRVARDLGWMTKMESDLSAYKEQLQKDVKQYQTSYNQQINNVAQSKRPKDLDPGAKFTLSPADSQEIQRYLTTERQTLQQLSQQAEQDYNSYRLKWVKQYRYALSPIVRQVATDTKVNIVMQMGDNVLFADSTVDITDAIVDAAKSKPPELTEIPMTHLQGPDQLKIDASTSVPPPPQNSFP